MSKVNSRGVLDLTIYLLKLIINNKIIGAKVLIYYCCISFNTYKNSVDHMHVINHELPYILLNLRAARKIGIKTIPVPGHGVFLLL
jgi:hypothetical protein